MSSAPFCQNCGAAVPFTCDEPERPDPMAVAELVRKACAAVAENTIGRMLSPIEREILRGRADEIRALDLSQILAPLLTPKEP